MKFSIIFLQIYLLSVACSPELSIDLGDQPTGISNTRKLSGREGNDPSIPFITADKSLICSSTQFYNANGELTQGTKNCSTANSTPCSSDGQIGCVTNSNFKAAEVAGAASKILDTATFAGVTGNVALPAANQVLSGTVFGSSGSLSGNSAAISTLCSSDGQIGCVTNSNFNAAQVYVGPPPIPRGFLGDEVSSSQTNLSWDDISVKGYLLIVSEGSHVTFTPTDGVEYSETSHGGDGVIYVGDSNNFNHEGLSPGNFFYHIYSYDSAFKYSTAPATLQIAPSGEQIYHTTGTFTVPAGVTSVSVLVVGGGGAGSPANTILTIGGSGGGGGGLRYINNLTVTPGDLIPVSVGSGGNAQASTARSGGPSSFGSHVVADGGVGGRPAGTFGGGSSGGSGSLIGGAIGGGNGGDGGLSGTGSYALEAAGGGGAGGYSGKGGDGTCGASNPGLDGAGGGGGGSRGGSSGNGGGGGGVGIYGEGASGAGAPTGQDYSCPNANSSYYTYKTGSGGSGGTPGACANGGVFGGGGGGGQQQTGYIGGGDGGRGVVRIIWGVGKSFPNNATP